jgi:hypothetical protein
MAAGLDGEGVRDVVYGFVGSAAGLWKWRSRDVENKYLAFLS